MIDIPTQLAAIYREVEARELDDGDEGVAVLMRRSYGATVEDVWDAVTDPERTKRWFLTLSGDLRVGGSFQLEGNASGDILVCEPPRLLRVTFGAPTSVVELRLTPEGDETILELEHTVPLAIAQSTAGALYVGPGWDGALMALDLYVRGEEAEDPVAAANSREAQVFSKRSVDAWTAAIETTGTATDDEIAAATEMSLAQFAPDLERDD